MKISIGRFLAVTIMVLCVLTAAASPVFSQVFEVSCNLKPQIIDRNYYVRSNPIVLTLKSDWRIYSAQELFIYPTTKYVLLASEQVSRVTIRSSVFSVNKNIRADQNPERVKLTIPTPQGGLYKKGDTFIVRGINFDVWNGLDPDDCQGRDFLACSEVSPGDFVHVVVTSNDDEDVVTFSNPRIEAVRVTIPSVRR